MAASISTSSPLTAVAPQIQSSVFVERQNMGARLVVESEEVVPRSMVCACCTALHCREGVLVPLWLTLACGELNRRSSRRSKQS